MNIRIECDGTGEASLEELQDFQGAMKRISKKDMAKLKRSIMEYGFSAPIFVWKQYILDGHQRVKALEELVSEGWEIGKVPIVKIKAKDITEAAGKLLVIASQYGKWSPTELAALAYTRGILLSDVPFQLAEGRIDFTVSGEDMAHLYEETDSDGRIVVCPNCGKEMKYDGKNYLRIE